VLRASAASSLAFRAKDPACFAASARLSELGLNPFSFGSFGFGSFAPLSFGIGTPSTFGRRSRWLSAIPPAIPAIPTPAARAGVFSFFAVVAIVLPALCAVSTVASLACSTVPLLSEELRPRLEGLRRFEAPLFALVVERLLCERELDRGFAVDRPLLELRVFERLLVVLRLEALLLLRLEAFLVRLEPLLVCWAIFPPRGGRGCDRIRGAESRY
jgi:hypothetical protein